ncbi:MAG: ribonucleotide reductase class Ia beta subunit [uncultured marine phage]|uniref:ribonucleoside-diphosphate reductase n=1 Tax=uncultured marine phage TaxID=707152 RepID=A0A8D9CDH4_9VIRU|nr:MAG: ribonucleotide reductase class Ia beta subunit [uncultured marine phage]
MSKDKKTIINLDNSVDFTQEPMFFGKSLNLQRYDKFRYEKIFTFFKTQLGFFWRPEEVNIAGKERNDFESLTEHQKFIFTKNLGYQILLDSVQGRGISHLLEDCSSPEIEAFAKTWEFSETIHSYSYTYIIKNVYPDASEIFDSVLSDPEIIKRTSSVTKYYDDLINKIDGDSEDDKKKKLYLTLMSINILEGIRFYVSFACSYSFAENKKMEGNAKIISLINRDENLHLGFTQTVLRLMRDEKSEGFQHIVKECEPIVYQMFEDAAKEEMDWADYLFEGGSMLGLNAEILKRYMKFLTNKRMKSLKLEPIFDSIQNPINWIDNWTESKSVQVAPQESEIESYVIGSFDQDIDDSDFGDFDI